MQHTIAWIALLSMKAVCCSTGSALQCDAVCCRRCRVLQCVAVCCSVLQSVAVCFSVLQCVAEVKEDMGPSQSSSDVSLLSTLFIVFAIC